METDYYLAADKRFYEPIDARAVEAADYLDFVSGRIDAEWMIVRKGIWINCHRRKNRLPVQGWKIHLSTVPKESKQLLEAAAGFLIAEGVSFKFLADVRTVRMTNGKGWSRGASGKFITIYPADFPEFQRLLEALDALTREFVGPYILSDRRYKDSKVLYYRYGGIQPNSRLQPDGRMAPVLVAPDGREVEDLRLPTYRLPDWVTEPFPGNAGPAAGGALAGRYAIEKALHFSNTGGVYLALDAVTGKKVVLKEARAHVHGFSDSSDAAELLREEYAVLERLADTGAAPRPVELFEEWEHLFLVEEYLEGYESIKRFAARGGAFLETRPTGPKIASALARELDIVRRLAAVVDVLHERGVVWGDISFNNVLVNPETLDVKIIDLESAQRLDAPRRPAIVTPGFYDARRPVNEPPTVEDDYYGVGAVLLFLVSHSNWLLGLKPRAGDEMLAELSRDFGLPPAVRRIVDGLMHETPSRREKPSALLERERAELESFGEGLFGRPVDAESGRAALESLIVRTCAFMKANAEPRRKDRLFPADSAVFETNPLGLAHGAAGALYALRKIEGRVAPELIDWLASVEPSADALPPGLYHGLSGVAWALLDLGRGQAAAAALDKCSGHALLRRSPDLYHGLAGWGMTNLHFWRMTGDPRRLEAAREAGEALLSAAEDREQGLCWPGKDGAVPFGLAHGASGIGLFLLYLDRAAGGGFETAARRALDFDIAQAMETDNGGLSWSRGSDGKMLALPYWKYGSAGVGVAALRFYKATGLERYRDLVEKIFVDCDRKYAVYPGRNDGLAGIGEFLLDAFLETGDVKFRDSALRLARGIELFAIEDGDGAAFPGNGLSRISCDLATGAAGIALFLDRLARPRPADFMLDELLRGGGR